MTDDTEGRCDLVCRFEDTQDPRTRLGGGRQWLEVELRRAPPVAGGWTSGLMFGVVDGRGLRNLGGRGGLRIDASKLEIYA